MAYLSQVIAFFMVKPMHLLETIAGENRLEQPAAHRKFQGS
jgi:hypothetical protein